MTQAIPPLCDRDGTIWFDGRFVPWREATVHVLAHTLHYGMGAFEGIRAYRGTSGMAIFRLREHIERLFDSAHILNMRIPYTVADLEQACIDSIRRNKLDSAQCVYIRPLVFYGFDQHTGSIGLHAKNLSVHVIVAAWAWGAYLPKETHIKTTSFARHHINVSMCRAKAVGNYLNSMMALNEADQDGYDDVLFLDTEGYVAEGSGANIFAVKNNTLYMPESGSMLYGITRDTIVHLARDLGYEVVEKRMTRDALYIADETFFVGTAAEVTPIISIDRRRIGTGKTGAITTQISKRYHAVVRGECNDRKTAIDYRTWLTSTDTTS